MRIHWDEIVKIGDGEATSCEGFTALSGKYNDILSLLDAEVELQKSRGLPLFGFCLTMPCGYSQDFINPDDIPHEDLPCPCGKGFLIKIMNAYVKNG